jgi:hypothetical protein
MVLSVLCPENALLATLMGSLEVAYKSKIKRSFRVSKDARRIILSN